MVVAAHRHLKTAPLCQCSYSSHWLHATLCDYATIPQSMRYAATYRSVLRHTVDTRLLKKAKNAKLVQRYLGHSDIFTTFQRIWKRLQRFWQRNRPQKKRIIVGHLYKLQKNT